MALLSAKNVSSKLYSMSFYLVLMVIFSCQGAHPGRRDLPGIVV